MRSGNGSRRESNSRLSIMESCAAMIRNGFRPSAMDSEEMRALLAQLLGLDPANYPVGKMTYDLRRLRLHGIIQRIPHSHRYQLSASGLGIALFFSRTYARLLRPKLAEIMSTA